MTLADLGQKAEINPSTVGNIENGTRTTEETLAKLASALAVPLDLILSETYPSALDIPDALREQPAEKPSPQAIRTESIRHQIWQLMDGFNAFLPLDKIDAAQLAAELAQELVEQVKGKK
jgi:transcriptional regulator with XRE-family HTH domain